jgi:hypothetical protein
MITHVLQVRAEFDDWYYVYNIDEYTGWKIYLEPSTKRLRLMPPEPKPCNDMSYLVASFHSPERALEYYIKYLSKYEHTTEAKDL